MTNRSHAWVLGDWRNLVILGLAVWWAAWAKAEEGTWKTVFYKRGAVGNFEAKWVGGEPVTLREPVYIGCDGSKVRVWYRACRDQDVALAGCSLVKGSDRKGMAEGAPVVVTAAGEKPLTIKAQGRPLTSDEVAAPIGKGLWYLQGCYESPKFLYAFDADGLYAASGDQQGAQAPGTFKAGSFAGNAYRIDVLTKDAKPVIACYGDSITQGAGSSPQSGNRYPELLGKMLDRPALNLGVNGDMACYAKGVPGILRELDGVDTVIFLMGINDVMKDRIQSVAEYSETIAPMVDTLQKQGMRVYLGTLTPGQGYKTFDASPGHEALRQQINEWIRTGSGADGVIDFDEALRDPANPAKLKEEYQHDWLHPNDAGDQKMAEAAAKALKS